MAPGGSRGGGIAARSSSRRLTASCGSTAARQSSAGAPISPACRATRCTSRSPTTPFRSLVRALQCAGALERVLELTVTHVSERVQFGRPLAKFQAIQQELAKLAGEVAAASAAADLAAETFLADPADAGLAIAVARVRIGEAVGRANGIAHQLHGAIGFTAEHRLHLFTTSLWAWRDEFGGAAHWAMSLGNRALAAGKDGFWPMVTAA